MTKRGPHPELRHNRIVEAFGWIGTVSLLTAFLANTQGWVASDAPLYLGGNLVGAVGVGVHAWTRRTWPAVVVEALWSTVALLGLVRAALAALLG
jgi:hypothetical protein